MRFKLHFNEERQKLEINCLNDNAGDIIIPEDVSQHIHYPIPNDLKKNIKKTLDELLQASYTQEFIDIDKQIKDLTNHRRAMMNKFRAELNPQIIEKCKSFRLDNAEHFI